MKKQKIAVALSGGVDSSVTAALLKQEGHDLVAIFMKNWEEEDEGGACSAKKDKETAQQICDQLTIPFYPVNFSYEYWESVFQSFLSDLKAGVTPNPDVLCNRWVKFSSCMAFALEQLGCDCLATGHYARLHRSGDKVALLKGTDPNKDQSYFLNQLTQEQLARTRFPLGAMTKKEVRQIAATMGLVTAKKPDSMGICFIGPKKFSQFIRRYIPSSPGPIYSETGTYLGEHHGLSQYTLGQRKGLHIGGRRNFNPAPWFVLEKDIARNGLIVTQEARHPKLYPKAFYVTSMHVIDPEEALTEATGLTVKSRYRQPDVGCQLTPSADRWLVTLNQPIRAVTPGQYAAFYQGDRVVGGGIIEAFPQTPLSIDESYWVSHPPTG